MGYFVLLKCGGIIFPQGNGNIIAPHLRRRKCNSCNFSINPLKKNTQYKNHGYEKIYREITSLYEIQSK